MVRAFRSHAGESLRLVLAAILLIAGLASARLQGDAAGVAALGLGDHAALCLPGSADPPKGETSGHQHCVLCVLQLVATPEAASPVRSADWQAVAHGISVAAVPARMAVTELRARGPPLAG